MFKGEKGGKIKEGTLCLWKLARDIKGQPSYASACSSIEVTLFHLSWYVEWSIVQRITYIIFQIFGISTVEERLHATSSGWRNPKEKSHIKNLMIRLCDRHRRHANEFEKQIKIKEYIYSISMHVNNNYTQIDWQL